MLRLCMMTSILVLVICLINELKASKGTDVCFINLLLIESKTNEKLSHDQQKRNKDQVHQLDDAYNSHSNANSINSHPPSWIPSMDTTETTSLVVTLNDNNFELFLTKEKNVIVMFYAPWCQHSKVLLPEYERAAVLSQRLISILSDVLFDNDEPKSNDEINMNNNNKISLRFAIADGTSSDCKRISATENIMGFPTMKLYLGKKENVTWLTESLGDIRTSSSILNFVRNRLFGAYNWINSSSILSRLLSIVGSGDEDHLPLVIAVLEGNRNFNSNMYKDEEREMIKSFKEIANQSKNSIQFFMVSSVSEIAMNLREASNLTSIINCVFVYRYFDSKPASQCDLAKLSSVKELNSFIIQSIVSPSSIVPLSEGDFQSVVLNQKDNVYLIEFYAPWCPYCQEFNADYEHVAKVFHDSPQDKVIVAKVDGTKLSESFVREYDINGYPTFILFKNGIPSHPYEGDIEVMELVKWVKSLLLPALVEVKTADDIDALFGISDEEFNKKRTRKTPRSEYTEVIDTRPLGVVVVGKSGLFTSQEDKANIEILAYKSKGKIKYAKLHPQSKLDIQGLRMYRSSEGRFKNNKEVLTYNRVFSTTMTIEQWASRSCLPNAINFSDEIMRIMADSGVKVAVFVFIPQDYEYRDDIVYLLDRIGNAVRYDALFSYVDIDYPSLKEYFGIPPTFNIPIAKVLHIESTKRFIVYDPKTPSNGDINPEYLESLVRDFYNNELTAYEPKELAPAEYDEYDEKSDDYRVEESNQGNDKDDELHVPKTSESVGDQYDSEEEDDDDYDDEEDDEDYYLEEESDERKVEL